jgi:hypothetical protein
MAKVNGKVKILLDIDRILWGRDVQKINAVFD